MKKNHKNPSNHKSLLSRGAQSSLIKENGKDQNLSIFFALMEGNARCKPTLLSNQNSKEPQQKIEKQEETKEVCSNGSFFTICSPACISRYPMTQQNILYLPQRKGDIQQG